MPVLLEGFYTIGSTGVPCPSDGSPDADWWWDHLAKQALELAKAGFTAIWLPPPQKCASGILSFGYDVYDDYDLGTKNQRGATPTRYGNREQLARCVATFRACGIDVYIDVVDHQRDGDITPYTFRYPGADGTPDIGRFPKDPPNFYPNVPEDPGVFDDPSDLNTFGRVLAPVNGQPAGYVSDSLIGVAAWLTKSLDLQGYRLDDVRGLSFYFLSELLNTAPMSGKFAVAEFLDGSLGDLTGWLFNPQGMNGRASAFDYPMYYELAAMCNGQYFDMSGLDHTGLAGVAPFNAVTFVENRDTDSGPNPVVYNKALGYAYILTSEGFPCVFYKDYSTDPGCYGLKPVIDPLIWIQQKFASGPTQQRWKDLNLFVYERLGQPGLLVALNNDSNNGRAVTVQTAFGPNRLLHDYAGHSGDVTTDDSGQAAITIPNKTDNTGRVTGYVCYAPAGEAPDLPLGRLTTTQQFEAAADLDIAPATNGKPSLAGRVWAAARTKVTVKCAPLPDGARLRVGVRREGAEETKTALFPGPALSVSVRETGGHRIEAVAESPPQGATNLPYTLTVTYQAPQTWSLPPSALSAP